jgi:hypothetical protein
MTEYRCDLCKRRVGENLKNGLTVRCAALDKEGLWGGVLLCLACAKPILAFLRTRKFIVVKK